MSLYDLPKDILIKLILIIEEITKEEFIGLYKKEYQNWNNIPMAVQEITPERLQPMVHRCAFPECKEIEVLNDKYGWTTDSKGYGIILNSCDFRHRNSDDSKYYYCDVHNILEYVKEVQYCDVYTVCPECKVEKLKEGFVSCKRYDSENDDSEDESEYELREQRRKQSEDQIIKKLKEDEQKLKISRYYKLSHNELIEKFIYIKDEIIEDCYMMYQEELDLQNYILSEINSILPKKYQVDIERCLHEGCENFSVYSDYSKTNHKHIAILSCDYCGGYNYCKSHISLYSHLFVNMDDLELCCLKCKREINK